MAISRLQAFYFFLFIALATAAYSQCIDIQYSEWSGSDCGTRYFWDANYTTCCLQSVNATGCFLQDNITDQFNYTETEPCQALTIGANNTPLYLWVFISLNGLVIALLILGVYMNIPVLKVVAWTGLFILSTAFMVAGVEYKSGETATAINSSVVITQDTYTNYRSVPLGFAFAVVFALAFAAELYNSRRAV